MDLDTNKDGKVSLIEGVAFVQGFLSATFVDVNRLLQTAIGALLLALSLWNAMHPTAAVAIPTTGPVPVPALPDGPVVSPADTDAPTPAPADTDAVKAAGGGS